MGMTRPALKTSSVEEYKSIFNGELFPKGKDPNIVYGFVKYAAAMWIGSMARKHPSIRMITMSPGGTKGTEVMGDLPFLKRIMFSFMFTKLLPLFGMVHNLEVGAKRYVDGINDDMFQTGKFYASKKNVSGPIVDQGTIFSYFYDETSQDNASEAIHSYIK